MNNAKPATTKPTLTLDSAAKHERRISERKRELRTYKVRRTSNLYGARA